MSHLILLKTSKLTYQTETFRRFFIAKPRTVEKDSLLSEFFHAENRDQFSFHRAEKVFLTKCTDGILNNCGQDAEKCADRTVERPKKFFDGHR